MARYIDADALIEHLKEYKTVYGTPMTNRDEQVIHCVIGHIKNLEPTVYDVEAVVAELEKLKDNDGGCDGVSCDNCKYKESCLEEEESYKVALDRAIEIVRGKE